MSNQLVVIGLVAVGVGVAYGFSMADRSMNYTEVQGKITSSTVDCFIKNSKGKLVEKTSNKMAYMDCKLAPVAAEQFGYSKADVHKRVKFTYSYKSPVDGTMQTGKGERTSSAEAYRMNASIPVYAHNETPSKSRLH